MSVKKILMLVGDYVEDYEVNPIGSPSSSKYWG